MLDVKNLEIRYKRYKLKKDMPYFIIAGIAILISFITIFMIINNNQEQKPILKSEIESHVSKPIEQTKPIEIEQVVKEEKIKAPVIIQDDKVVLTPSLSFMNKIEPDMPPSKTIAQNKIIEKEILSKEIEEVREPLHVKDKKVFVNIERNNDADDIEEVIKRFKVNNNPALSLFIAKKYYQLGEYEKAYNYALITNKINNNIDASWVLFSKSLVKLNKKEMAIETLKKYIEYSNSQQAKQLLDEISSGKFK
ncbi:MAG: hypothetical protein A2513_08445 [Sulfurimonas sp. RIFOXYD12_FULL_33_39]|uniref:CDC27 family protein n=1 Tax=unclassified Sulfurimonas TaxID=2623549 RepID=UPI0008B3792A|nr:MULTISPECIES: CDC27 family protein [unclassified Sulfurimonas]OHE02491.1 MAG: hypothetical protein A3G74_04140 [Sulfurimonas sp. RIFCSPLOWO2_12_FULL_34_6]OHE10114.1 MAG: hypothetical protein A2513_08445 [Sulfurimonas sp. RIFOXYD12_FULL_33_39]OHE14665.1 MAG: hypothetical protein A2530_02035 [Sulfurimonas sp. RIFOXYD2_FULL_34_21]DAB28147.1 MAG TPA: hypothetical protein CFH78_04015 [Sulfurimonas sp. UBA10385]